MLPSWSVLHKKGEDREQRFPWTFAPDVVLRCCALLRKCQATDLRLVCVEHRSMAWRLQHRARTVESGAVFIVSYSCTVIWGWEWAAGVIGAASAHTLVQEAESHMDQIGCQEQMVLLFKLTSHFCRDAEISVAMFSIHNNEHLETGSAGSRWDTYCSNYAVTSSSILKTSNLLLPWLSIETEGFHWLLPGASSSGEPGNKPEACTAPSPQRRVPWSLLVPLQTKLQMRWNWVRQWTLAPCELDSQSEISTIIVSNRWLSLEIKCFIKYRQPNPWVAFELFCSTCHTGLNMCHKMSF